MNERGFTLIEVMIAGVVSVLVVFGGFAALNSVQRASARQQEADEVVGAARVALEVISRDLRTAGDSFNMLPSGCLGAETFPVTLWSCAAVLDPHPWRITIARNAWEDSATLPDASRFSVNDAPPSPTRAFDDDPQNAVTFRFVPYESWGNEPQEVGGKQALLGRIERVENPFSFTDAGTPASPSVAVLLDNVVLDDAMRVNPADPTDVDHRYDHALFMYQLLTFSGELHGDAALVERNTTANDWFLTPPIQLFTREVPAGYPNDAPAAPPYMPSDYTFSGVGLELDASGQSSLVKTPVAGTTPGSSLSPAVADSQLRYILDRNRIRAVRVAFKVAAQRERADVKDGFDLDGDPENGTAQLYSFESIVELKPLSRFLTDS